MNRLVVWLPVPRKVRVRRPACAASILFPRSCTPAAVLATYSLMLLFFVVSVAGFVLSRRAVMEAVLNQLSVIVPVYKEELHQNLAVTHAHPYRREHAQQKQH